MTRVTLRLAKHDLVELIDCLVACADRLDATDFSAEGEALVERAHRVVARVVDMAKSA